MQTWQGLNFRRESFDIFPTPGLRNFGSVTKPWTAQTVQILGQQNKQKTLFDKTADSKNTKHKHSTRQCGKTVKNNNRAEETALFSADVSGWVKQPSDSKHESKFPFS